MPSQVPTATLRLDRRTVKAVKALKRTRESFRAFMRAFPPHRPYYWGVHTRVLCRVLQDASDAVLRGERRYVVVVMPPRHGKSDMVARRFPAWHLLRAPGHEVILAGYSGELATDLSLEARRTYRFVAPAFGLGLDEARQRVGSWRTTRGGGMFAVGLGGTITGRGAHVLLVDDYLRGREEAESRVMRDKVWDGFRNDLLTRLAPAHAVVIACTRWHEDDLVGRLLRAADEDPAFPRFELLRFPAWRGNPGWLFPERFSTAWYESQRAALGSYFWQACYQGDPQPREGNLLRVDRVQLVDEVPQDGMRWARGWDLASTAKERLGSDPDYTVGVLVGMRDGELWIADVQRGRWTQGERDARIEGVAAVDGPSVKVGIEAVAGYKDTAERMKRLLAGRSVVEAVHPDRDKVARAAALEPLFEAGRVYVKRAEWTEELLAELRAFPGGRHDDQVDALVIAYGLLSRPLAGVVQL